MRPVLLVVLLFAAAQAPGAAETPQDDCGLGSDAPDSQASAAHIHPHICDGSVVSGDPGDWYAFRSEGYYGFAVRGDPGVRICHRLGDGSQWCAYGQLSQAVYYRGDIWFAMTGLGSYNMSVQLDGQRNPAIDRFECVPRVVPLHEVVSCTVNAKDDSRGVRYRMQWGDGQESWSPSPTQYHWPNRPVTVSHTYAQEGEHLARLTVYDEPHLDFHPVYTATAERFLHVPSPTHGGTRLVKAYSAGAGDLACVLGTGCVYFNAVQGETHIDVAIDDLAPWKVGGYVCAEATCREGERRAFCGSTTIALLGRDARVVVMLDEAFGPIDCGLDVGLAARGTVTALLRVE